MRDEFVAACVAEAESLRERYFPMPKKQYPTQLTYLNASFPSPRVFDPSSVLLLTLMCITIVITCFCVIRALIG